MQKPTLYIFAGANGSGKTTIAKNFTKHLKVPFINADEIAARLGHNAELQAGRLFIHEFEKRILKNKSFAIESTLSGKTIINHLISAKKKRV